MKKVTKYEAEDGTLHETSFACHRHEVIERAATFVSEKDHITCSFDTIREVAVALMDGNFMYCEQTPEASK